MAKSKFLVTIGEVLNREGTHDEIVFLDMVDPRPCDTSVLWEEYEKRREDIGGYPQWAGEGLPYLPTVEDDILFVTPEQKEVLEFLKAVYGNFVIAYTWPAGEEVYLSYLEEVVVVPEDRDYSPYRWGRSSFELHLNGRYYISERGTDMYRTLRYVEESYCQFRKELAEKGDFSFTWDGVPHSVKEVLERGDTYVEPPIDRGSLIKFIKMPKGELMKIWEKRGLEPGEVEALRAALRQKGVICRGC